MKAPKQATIDAQKELMDVMTGEVKDIILSSGRKVRINWLRPDTQTKIDELFVKYESYKKTINKNDNSSIQKGNVETRKFYAQTVAAILINNYFGLKLFWWMKWRVIYHFWQLNGADYSMIITEAKKKATEQQYYLAMALLMTMTNTWTMMTKKEAEAYRQELELASRLQS